jgi:hypothetical protein
MGFSFHSLLSAIKFKFKTDLFQSNGLAHMINGFFRFHLEKDANQDETWKNHYKSKLCKFLKSSKSDKIIII